MRKYKRTHRFIYKTTNLINGKIYIGQHTTHNIDDGYLGSGDIFKSAIKKHGRENFVFEILQRDILARKELDEAEIYWIAQLNATNPEIGYNRTMGGEGGDTITMHPNHKEICEKRSKILKGKGVGHGFSEESLLKISKTLKNKPFQTCLYCGLQSRNAANMKRYHFDNCKQNPNRIIIIKEKKPDVRPTMICPWCGFQSKSGSGTKQFHFDNCRLKPGNENKIYPSLSVNSRKQMGETLKNRPIKTCFHCGFQSNSDGMMVRWHNENCKHNPNKNIVNIESKIA